MVAAVIALVAVASLITMTIGNPQANDMMAAKAPSSTFTLPVQELETVYTDANEELHKVVEFQRSLKRIYASNPNPISEGTQRNKVIAANEISKPNNTYTNSQQNEEALAYNDVKTQPDYNSNGSDSKIAMALKDEANIPISSNVQMSKNQVEEVARVESATYATADEVVEEEYPNITKLEKPQAPEGKISSPAMEMQVVESSSPAPMAKARVLKKENNAWYLGIWKYDDNLKRDEKFQIINKNEETFLVAVSYTHLTLPTICSV